jgi:hypothetical protein
LSICTDGSHKADNYSQADDHCREQIQIVDLHVGINMLKKIPKLEKDFIAVGKIHQFALKSLQEIQSCKNMVHHISVKAERQPEMTWRNLFKSLLLRKVVCDSQTVQI